MKFVLDPSGRSPLFQQLKDQIRYAISVGDLAPGDCLPSIREVEATHKVNRNTVRRAYVDLEAEGLLTLRQGREAQVAARPYSRMKVEGREQAALAEELAGSLLQRAELEGLDGVEVAEYFGRISREHDAAHPKWVFLECSPRQAACFAGDAERLLGRRVVGVDLHELRGVDGAEAGSLPPSIRFVLTPHWHAGEARALLEPLGLEVFGVRVRISAACAGALGSLRGVVGLVVRDAESAPGFADIVRQHVRAGQVGAITSGDERGLVDLCARADAIVYTTPCAHAVAGAAPAGKPVHELEFEPVPEDLAAVREQVFPALTGAGLSV